jgi:hypothetical protein
VPDESNWLTTGARRATLLCPRFAISPKLDANSQILSVEDG